MKSTSTFHFPLWTMAVAVAIAVGSALQLSGQDAKPKHGLPKDWSMHHLVFSNPGTEEEAIKNGTYDHWLKVTSDPRYILQQELRAAAAAPPSLPAPPPAIGDDGDDNGPDIAPPPADAPLPRGLTKALIPASGLEALPPDAKKPPKNRIHKDWSVGEGANGTSGLGEFPATYTGTATPCATDYAAYNTGLAGVAGPTGQANIVGFNNIYNACNGGPPNGPSVYFAYNTGTLGAVSGATIANSVVLSLDGTQLAFVQSVPYSVAASGTATTNGTVPTSGSTITIGTSPGTTYTWTTTTNVTTVNQMSTSGLVYVYQIAQTLYAALTGSRANCPTSNTTCISASQTANNSITAAWNVNTVTVTASCGTGTCGNSVVFTDSGSNAEFTLSPTGGTLSGGSGSAGVGGAQLVVLKLAAGGTIANPTTLTSNSSYPSCMAPCMIAVALSGTPTDTYSSPFYDYTTGSDTLYVGDDAGKLHKFTNVFSGTATEATSPWPVQVSSTTTTPPGGGALGSPIYDPAAQLVFVGDYLLNYASSCAPSVTELTGSCGYMYSVTSSGSTVVQSAQLDYQYGIVDGPIADPSTGEVFAFVGADKTTSCSGPCAGVFEFPVAFTAGSGGTEAQVGAGYEFMLSGSFDNDYYISTSPAATGTLYTVGGTGPQNNTLYGIEISSGNISGTVNIGPAVAANYTNGYYAGGLQITEFYTGTTDYLFLGTLAFGNPSACAPFTGTVSTSGTTVTWVSGSTFVTGSAWVGLTITINSVPYVIASVSSTTSLTLAATAGSHTGVAYSVGAVSVGCVIGYTLSGSPYSTATYSGAIQSQGGSSGIVVDNSLSTAQNIYYSSLLNASSCTTTGTGGCAVQVAQSAE